MLTHTTHGTPSPPWAQPDSPGGTASRGHADVTHAESPRSACTHAVSLAIAVVLVPANRSLTHAGSFPEGLSPGRSVAGVVHVVAPGTTVRVLRGGPLSLRAWGSCRCFVSCFGRAGPPGLPTGAAGKEAREHCVLCPLRRSMERWSASAAAPFSPCAPCCCPDAGSGRGLQLFTCHLSASPAPQWSCSLSPPPSQLGPRVTCLSPFSRSSQWARLLWKAPAFHV